MLTLVFVLSLYASIVSSYLLYRRLLIEWTRWKVKKCLEKEREEEKREEEEGAGAVPSHQRKIDYDAETSEEREWRIEREYEERKGAKEE